MQTPGWRAGWRTSTRSNNGTDCVEVDFTATGMLMRDTKDRGTGTVIDFTADQWVRFVHEVLDGLPSANGAVTVSHRGTVTEVRSLATDRTLRYTAGEWTAFLAGARDGEFDYAPGTGRRGRLTVRATAVEPT